MRVLIDTSVWSLAFRRTPAGVPAGASISVLTELINEHRVEMIGPIRQELLSGIQSSKQFEDLREKLRAFTDLQLDSTIFERAAEMANLCRSKGIQGSHTDFLICAAAEHWHLAILTTDQDFTRYAKHLPIRLFPTD